MSKHSLCICKLSGIPIHLHLSWPFLFLLITYTLASAYFPARYPWWPPALYYALATLTSMLLFLSLLAHEAAHALVARRHGLAVHAIVLFLLGGVSEIDGEPSTPRAELAMAAAGPLASLCLGITFGALWLGAWLRGYSQPLTAVLGYVGGINLSLGLFNLIPGFPLDGGRILRAALWWASHSVEWATRWATRGARLIALGLFSAGIWEGISGSVGNGLWLAGIAGFLDTAARRSYQQVVFRGTLAGHTVGEAMARDYLALSPDTTLQEIAERGLLEAGLRCIPLLEDGNLRGLLTARRMQALPRGEWARHTARQAMIPASQLHAVGPSAALLEALDALGTSEEPLPVFQDGRLVGILPPERISAFVDLHLALGRHS
jgi:Zn-dependent protease/CBS domain-containing protein